MMAQGGSTFNATEQAAHVAHRAPSATIGQISQIDQIGLRDKQLATAIRLCYDYLGTASPSSRYARPPQEPPPPNVHAGSIHAAP